MIRFENVTKKFGEVMVLDKLSFKIGAGEFVFIIGPSGAGKTTVFRLILRDYLPTSGKIEIASVDTAKIPQRKIHNLRKNIGIVFQDLRLLNDRTVFENIALSARLLGKKEEKIKDKVMDVLKLVGLAQRADFFPLQLSGGELQRTCLARAIVGEPEIILADEPTGNLDLKTARQMVELLKKINKAGRTIVMATHNFEIVNSMEERVIELDKGKILSDKKKGKYHLP